MTTDSDYMRLALELAEKGRYTCQPNPMVGCVLVKEDIIIGQGWHQQAGQAHAEVNAIADAHSQGNDTSGATAYVSLEPCSHHGKTPPCTVALIAAGVAKVWCATTDPNPKVAGRGIRQLLEAGIEASTLPDESIQRAATHLNRAFFHRMLTGMPYVILKVATTLDGRTADYQGHSQWITSDAAREDVQSLRASSGAVLTGSGTQLADDPRLNVRLAGISRQPYRVLLDSQLQLATDAKIIGDDQRLIVYTAVCDDPKMSILRDRLHSMHCDGTQDLANILTTLAALEINQVMIEAGAILSGAFLAQNLVDEIVQYIAPSALGDHARAAFAFPSPLRLNEKKSFSIQSSELIGDDLKIVFVRASA